MSVLRFESLQALCEAFPTAQDDIGAEADRVPILNSLRSFVEGMFWDKAISLCAYLLPRREAVWWGCKSLRRIQPELGPAESAAIEAAETWVKEPGDELRRQALEIGMLGDVRFGATWMALAAGWSGGDLMPPEYGPSPVEPYQTARAIRAGLLIALGGVRSQEMARTIHPWIDNAVELIQR